MMGRNVLSARRANESAARQGYILDAEEASSESLLTWLLGLLVVLVTITLGQYPRRPTQSNLAATGAEPTSVFTGCGPRRVPAILHSRPAQRAAPQPRLGLPNT